MSPPRTAQEPIHLHSLAVYTAQRALERSVPSTKAAKEMAAQNKGLLMPSLKQAHTYVLEECSSEGNARGRERMLMC